MSVQSPVDSVYQELVGSGIRLAASLPDDWLVPLIDRVSGGDDILHVGVAREMEAVGVCSGAFFGGERSVCLMGIAGLFTCVHELACLSLAHGIPLFIVASLRGTVEDPRTYQVAQGLYGLRVLDALTIPYEVVDDASVVWKLGRGHAHARLLKRPYVLFLSKKMLTP